MSRSKKERTSRYLARDLIHDILTHFDDDAEGFTAVGMIYAAASLHSPDNTRHEKMNDDRRKRGAKRRFVEYSREFLYGALERMNADEITADTVQATYLELIAAKQDEVDEFSQRTIEGKILAFVSQEPAPDFADIGRAVYSGAEAHASDCSGTDKLFAEYHQINKSLDDLMKGD